ncbi:GspE/PulE family protein [Pseudoduganella namucuonensis]|uniref:Type II secretory pathway ATPase GspE/PulE or T4P pilus assembly pathway ATPase PilB n=1 Tax=Pseudoduganella namucuonensis TaxID=1035707 RepID=A0A1I7L8B3_9BURK|nr:ATPase, T2SS/T4P/T4SS family [Pseudoduganella namucuonensis]SFV05776.1 Type II secretory pathway ATPase GspE/PulE or T4P pilus assembly pathway ATPase PilB [Pseudoduganella namucuonensis]
MNLFALKNAEADAASRSDRLDQNRGGCDFSGAAVASRTGVFEASGEEKKLLCLLSDGRLLVAEGQSLNPHVLSYQARLEKMHRPFQVVFTKIETIARTYQGGVAGGGAERHEAHSMMQVTAKDLLSKACGARASDIHIRVKKNCTEILFRIHNDLVPAGSQTREYGERLLATLYGAMTSVSDNSYKPMERQDAAISDRDKLPPRLYGVRIATAPTSEGMVMVLRLLYNDAGDNVDVRPLGFSDTHAALLQQLKEQPIGMNIISGPTGSGKSTTLQRILSGEIIEAEGKLHVLTVEDPVEYPIDGAVQTAVTNASSEADRSRQFAAAISNAMRLDPDVIMIGEMRDAASAQNALRAAMTGHQVWTTVHANSALAIVDRLVDLGLALSLVADHTIITGLISQRLVKVLCQHCCKPLVEHPHELPPAAYARVQHAVGGHMHRVRIAGPGCEHCKQQGTIGRSVIAEVIVPDDQFFKYIRAGEKTEAMAYWLHELGGKTIREHAIEKIAAGLVDPRMAEKVVGHLSTVPSQDAPRHSPEMMHAV